MLITYINIIQAGLQALENAVDGEVVTRFPPEPSGYLHIGHVKALMLNWEYAKVYNGKMILRFDDTNPAKEKGEYVESFIHDIKRLNIQPHMVTHTSDSFEIINNYALQMIKEGKAFMDDTDVDTMRTERMNRIESKHR
jgi:glutamyl-tRNA synthetase